MKINKIKDCKNLREVLDLISIDKIQNISLYLIMIWIISPLLMMIGTPIIGNYLARLLLFILVLFIGFIGVLFLITVYLIKFYKKNQKNIFRKYLPYFLGFLLLTWCFITCYFSTDPETSIFGTFYRHEGLETYVAYAGIFSLGVLIKKENKIKKIINMLIIVSIIMAVISILNNSLTYSLFKNQEPYTGIFSQFNHYGYYLMFGIVTSIFMYLKNNKYKIIYLLSYSLLLYTLLKNNTFGCYLSVLITIILLSIYYIFILKKFKILLPILLLLISISFFTKTNSESIFLKNFFQLKKDSETVIKNDKEQIANVGTTRGLLWEYGIKFIGERPITGYGIETLEKKYANCGIPQDRPHNILIQFGLFTGIPGIILYIFFISSIVIKSFVKIKKLNHISLCAFFMVICYLMSSMFGNSMFYTSPYFMIFLGILASNTFYIKNNLFKTKKI